MGDRKKLQEEINRINELYQQYDNDMKRIDAPMEDRQKMRDMLNTKKASLNSQYGDDLQKLNSGGAIKVSNANPNIVTKSLGKKLLGMLPVVGGLAQAGMSGDVLAGIDPTDSEELGRDSDIVGNTAHEESLLTNPPENIGDPEMSEQARRWQKVRGMMGQ